MPDGLFESFLAREWRDLPFPNAQRWSGWLDHEERVGRSVEAIRANVNFRFPRTVLLGMGGSSSAAGIFTEHFTDDGVSVEIIDSSHPDVVQDVSYEKANVIVSSKSGNTIETQANLALALDRGAQPRDMIFITDPDSQFASFGRAVGASVVAGDELAGGRFSSLSAYGIVPAVAAGWTDAHFNFAPMSLEQKLRALRAGWDQGIKGGTASLSGDPLTSFRALWQEQLIAESTGKDGKGLIPVAGENGKTELIPWIVSQHYTVVGMCLALGVNPFDQPDVEHAKRHTFEELVRPLDVPYATIGQIRSEFQKTAGPVSLQVYGNPAQSDELREIRDRLEVEHGVVAAGFGPRYLHSTGQLFKGGPNVFTHVLVDVRPQAARVRIPGRRFSFADLVQAQARADFRSLREAGRTVYRIVVDEIAELEGICN